MSFIDFSAAVDFHLPAPGAFRTARHTDHGLIGSGLSGAEASLNKDLGNRDGGIPGAGLNGNERQFIMPAGINRGPAIITHNPDHGAGTSGREDGRAGNFRDHQILIRRRIIRHFVGAHIGIQTFPVRNAVLRIGARIVHARRAHEVGGWGVEGVGGVNAGRPVIHPEVRAGHRDEHRIGSDVSVQAGLIRHIPIVDSAVFLRRPDIAIGDIRHGAEIIIHAGLLAVTHNAVPRIHHAAVNEQSDPVFHERIVAQTDQSG